MARVRVQLDDDFSEWPLASTEIIGRHWRNSLRIRSAAVPQFWLELRWRPTGWCWRPLAAFEITRGTGAVDGSGWRLWPQAGGVARLDGSGSLIEVRILDTAAPQPIVEDVGSRRRYNIHEATNLVESWPDGRVWPLGADVEVEPPLAAGDVFQVWDGIYRLLEAAAPLMTEKAGPSIAEQTLAVTLDLERMQALVESQGWDARVAGECVRVVAAYAKARLADGDDGGGGWLPAEAAHAEWIALGGRPQSPIARLGWERGKFRSQLAQQGVSGLERLFETRRHNGVSEVRIALDPDQLTVVAPQ